MAAKRAPAVSKPASRSATPREPARGRGFAEPVSSVDDAAEVEAHRLADAAGRGDFHGLAAGVWSVAAGAGAQTIWRAPKEEERSAPTPAPAAAPSNERDAAPRPAQDVAQPGIGKASNLLAEDDAAVARGQMRKSDFLARLREAVCVAVDEGLSGTGRDSQGCPWIDHWLDYYAERSASQIEVSLRRYAPEARDAGSAEAYVAMVAVRVHRSAATFARTGQVVGVPQDLPAGVMPGGEMLDSFGGMFYKARPGGPRALMPPGSIHEELGEGRQLPADVRSRMEPAFGTSFADVRLHADEKGAQLSDQLNAHAFTVGRHVAFGAGEFRPGTVAGDALIAHELAHVVQQGGSAASSAMAKSNDGAGRLEADADRSAVAVVESLWNRTRQSGNDVRRNAVPRIRTGLRLSRCGKSERQKEIERLGKLQSGHMEDKRKAEEARLKKEAEDEAKKKGLPPPVTAPKVELEDIVKKDVDKHSLKASPTTPWDTADQPAWEKRAAAAWASVVASVKGTELEKVAKGVTFDFAPKKALEGGFYAQQDGNTLRVGMSWVQFAEQDPKNVWENLAHEMAGHLQYGTTYAKEIMDAALSPLSADERKRVIGDPQKFFEAYEYPETEIYASLWQRRYRVPPGGGKELPSGGIHPDDNIEKRLKVMKDALHPDVANAVLKELKRRVDANDQILQRDKDFFVQKVKDIMGISL
jgi:hypothetical protein